jgi:hypothetical protein
MIRTTILALCCLLTACGTPTVSKDYDLAKSANKGLVIMSLSQVNMTIATYPAIIVNYRPVGARPMIEKRLVADEGGLVLDSRQWTRLHVFELEEGEYEFYRFWAGGLGTGRDYITNLPDTARFSVKAGRATYAGMLEFEVSSDRRFNTNVVDKRERDIPVFVKEWPTIPVNRIDYQLFRMQ